MVNDDQQMVAFRSLILFSLYKRPVFKIKACLKAVCLSGYFRFNVGDISQVNHSKGERTVIRPAVILNEAAVILLIHHAKCIMMLCQCRQCLVRRAPGQTLKGREA